MQKILDKLRKWYCWNRIIYSH